MEKFINYLQQYGPLTPQQVDLIQAHIKIVKLEKEDYFSEAGKIARRVSFVLEGILRVCYYNKDGEEITRYFVDENNFAVDLNSFQNQIPSSEYIQAIVPTTLLVFEKESLVTLSNTIIIWDTLMNKIISKALMEKVNRISPMIAEDAKTRYLNFQERFPTLVNRVPLNYLASYIGITKHSLSRIRKEIAKK